MHGSRREIVPLDEDWDRLIKEVESRVQDSDLFPKMLWLQMKIGMRLGEMQILKWQPGKEDQGIGHSRRYVYLNEKSKTITVYFKKRRRSVPVHHVWEDVFEPLLEKPGTEDVFVFQSRSGSSHITARRWLVDIGLS